MAHGFLFAGSKKPRRSGANEMRLCNACLVLGQQVGFFQRRAQGQVRITAQTVDSSELISVTPLAILVKTEAISAGWPKMKRLRK